MNLYLVHCGFYDSEICDGIYESHINLFAAGETIEEAKKNVRFNPTFQCKKMHIDGIQEVSVIDGFQVSLNAIGNSRATNVISHLHRDL